VPCDVIVVSRRRPGYWNYRFETRRYRHSVHLTNPGAAARERVQHYPIQNVPGAIVKERSWSSMQNRHENQSRRPWKNSGSSWNMRRMKLVLSARS